MAIAYPGILALRQDAQAIAYTVHDARLYARGIGLGSRPLDARERRFVQEADVLPVPTLASAIAWHAGPTPGQLGLNHAEVLHAAEDVVLHRPMPAAASVLADASIVEVADKGVGKGAFLVRQTVLRDARDGRPLATVRKTLFARLEGGFGGPGVASDAHGMPERQPDHSIHIRTSPHQAAIYSLCGDRNPLHRDPAAARAAGFPSPILHGACTFGMTCRAVLMTLCNAEPTLIRRHAARLTAPVYPGEMLTVDLWRDGDVVSFEARVAARGVKVISAGRSLLGPPS